MKRSSGIPRSAAIAGHTRVIRARSRDVTVSRPTKTTNELDEVTETTTERTASIWLFQPRESIADEIAGERIDGGIGGLVVSDKSVDLQKGDVVTYGGVEYELDTIVGHPEDGEPGNAPDTAFWMLDFERRQ